MTVSYNPATTTAAPSSMRGVSVWLFLIAFMIFVMVLIGGATRLTDSGLSITEWKPIVGAIPPLSTGDWMAEFEKYKQIPEFKLQNSQMTLAEFQFIYFWEWLHRFWGRLIGIAFALPLIYFAVRKRIGRRLLWRLAIIFVLGGAQGALGWWMVKSGLSERTDVSQYRLAAHLSLAVALLGAVLWTAFGVRNAQPRLWSLRGVLACLIVLIVFLQIAIGGLVAGLDAGMGYATWPKMDGQWIPAGLDSMQPLWKNFFENAMTVQFVHRMMAYVVLLLAALHAFSSIQKSSMLLFYGVLAQAVLGIATLLSGVSLPVALAHQGLAMVVFGLAVWNLHRQTGIRKSAL